MTAKDIEVLRDLEKFIYPEKGSIAIKFKQALSRAITLAEKVQSVKGIVPEEIEETPIEKDTKVLYSWNKCCQETAIRLVAFGERLEGIIKKYFFKPSISEQVTDKTCMICGTPFKEERWEAQRKELSQAILQELGIKE